MIESEQIVKAVRWLEKVRKKILVVFFLLVAAACGVYFESDFIISFLSRPLKGVPLYFTTPVEGVMTKIELSFFGGLLIIIPIIIYIVLSLVSGRFPKSTRRLLYFLVIPFAAISFFGGMAFAYFLVLPTTVQFFFDCTKDFMKPVISARSYFSFIIFFLVSVGIVFELPLVLAALSRLGLLTSKLLMKKRKIAIMVSVIAMAILTPTPDAFTLIVVSLPMVLLFEISIWWIFIMEKLESRKGVKQCRETKCQ